VSDFWYILSDPTVERLGRMLEVGQRCTFPKLEFVKNRLVVERVLERGRRITRSVGKAELADGGQMRGRKPSPPLPSSPPPPPQEEEEEEEEEEEQEEQGKEKFTWLSWSPTERSTNMDGNSSSTGLLEEMENQGSIFFDDVYGESSGSLSSDEEVVVEKLEADGAAAGGI